MWHPTIRADCCTTDTIPAEYFECFKKQICDELNELNCKHMCAFTKRRRIHQLATPKRRVVKFVPKCPCMFAKPGTIVHLEPPCYTRTEQLAYPSVRRLLLFKEAFKRKIHPKRLDLLNRLIRLSLFSVYSRLSNIQPPQPRIPIPIWDKDEWKQHTKYLKKLAKPKRTITVKGPHNPKMPLKEMKRFKKLAIPHLRVLPEKEPWVFTSAMNNYKPSERIRKIAAPLSVNKKWEPSAEESEITPEALRYKATERIVTLAKPLEKRSAASDTKENPFTISPNALKYKATKRIKEIAEPKEYENKHIRDQPFAISPQALKAKASPRLIELAEPKTRREKS